MISLSLGLLLIAWFIYCIFKYDVFIFGFGTSMLPYNLDLPLLKLLKKRVISNLAHGSEARPPYIDGFYQSKDGVAPSLKEIARFAASNRKTVLRHQTYASIVIGAPFSTSHFADRPFINHFALGIPFRIKAEPGLESKHPVDNEARLIRILH